MNAQAYAQTATTLARVGELFDAAADLEPDARNRFLEKACGDNVELRRRVEALLIADAQVGGTGDNTRAIGASAATWACRAQEFIVRNAVGVASLAGIMLLLMVILVAATNFQNQRINEQRLVAESIGSFLKTVLLSADPNVAQGSEVTAEQLLDEGTRRIATDLEGQPRVQAEMMSLMGVGYTNLGNYERAKPLLEMALKSQQSEDTEPLTLVRTRNAYGKVLTEQASYEEAAMVFRQALATAREDLGADSPEVSRTLTGLGLAMMEIRNFEEAEALLREAYALDRRILAADDARLADSSTGLGSILWRRDQFDEAETYYVEALELRRRLLGNSHPDTMESVNNLAALLTNRGDLAGAEVLFREALAQNERLLGPEHPDIAINLNNLGYVLMAQGSFEEAETAYERALAIENEALGADHPDLAYSLNSLADILTRTGKYDQAEQLFEQALIVMGNQADFEHRLTGQVMANYAVLLSKLGRFEEAFDFAQSGRGKIEAEYGPAHWRVAFADSVLGEVLAGLGRIGESRALLQDAVAPIEESMGENSVFARDARNRLALID